MTQCLISLGANLGDPRESIRSATKQLVSRLCDDASQARVSSFYHTPPVGGPAGQPPFVNAVVFVETELDPWQTWSAVRQVENDLGRVRQTRWEARKIDVDILLFGDQRIWTPQLKIPHPRMCMRRFILGPACEVAGHILDPVSGLSIAELNAALAGQAAHIAVVANNSFPAISIVEEATRATGAQLVQSPQVHLDSFTANAALAPARQSTGRVVQFYCVDDFSRVETFPQSNLTIYLTPPISVEGALWEDFHRVAAERLNLSETATSLGRQAKSIAGRVARYLLASDSPSWASHEIIAALQAMDCPIERLPE